MTNLYLIVLIGVTVAFVAGQTTVVLPPGPIITTTSPDPTQPPPKPTDPPKPTPKPTDPTPKPTDPTKPTPKPTDPPKPTPKPTDPTKPTPKPTDPTKPTPKPTDPTVSPKPTAPPTPPKPVDPKTGIWQVNGTNKTTCLLVKFALQIQIPYHYVSNKTTELAFLDIPEDASSSGVCENGTESITLTWKQNVTDNFTQTVTLSFAENSTIHKYYLKEINVKVVPDSSAFPGIIDDEKNKTIELTYNKEDFQTSLSKSYKCDKNQVLNLTDVGDNKPRGAIHISHVQFQAFEESKNKEFTNVEDCEPSDTPDIVPIAVGCALAVLVIVVLVAYLIGRRRRQARGYLSM